MNADQTTARRPKNAIVVLLDSLNRHMLGAYGGREFATPNLDFFARRAVRFDRHYSGSLPCIPARHDILCGAIDFLWKPWGSIEIWERPLTAYLRAAGVATKLVSDHPHLFEVGGENYHTDFSAWDYQRGHESDPWQTRPDPSWMGAPSFARGHTPYDNSRGYFRDETDFPGPRTMAAATEWLERSARSHERFMLFVDEFDPHEPFDTPEPYASMYDSSWQGPHMIWPPYVRGALAHGVLTIEQARQIRACYGAKLTMIDAWLGKLLAAIERGGFYDDTAVIICTDHGHYLGEKDIWGKPAVPIYEPLGHTPLLIAMPGVAAGTIDALTTNVDICATLAEIFGVEMAHRTHGRSMLPLMTGEVRSIRDWALAGVWGREVHLIDADAKYARAPSGDNAPLSLWSNRWSTMPIHHMPQLQMPPPDERAVLDRMPGAMIPVIRQPFRAGDLLPFWAMGKFSGNHLYRVRDDPKEDENLARQRSRKAIGREASRRFDRDGSAQGTVRAPRARITLNRRNVMAAKIVGGCMCGAVRYESATDAVMQASCYCRDCQRSTGSAFAPVLLVPKEAFKLTKGELKQYEVTGDSGNKVSRGFCANCGSPIMSLLFGMPFTAIKASSLDDPNLFQPTASIFVASAPKWAPHFPGVPTFARNPG